LRWRWRALHMRALHLKFGGGGGLCHIRGSINYVITLKSENCKNTVERNYNVSL
jgi:hypothetical protein